MSRGAQAPITFQMAIPTETMISQYSVRIPALAMQPIGSRVKIRQIVPTRTVTVTSLWLRLRQLVAQTEANAAWRAPLLGLRWPLCDPYDPTLAVLAKGGVVRGAAFFFQRSPHGPSRYCSLVYPYSPPARLRPKVSSPPFTITTGLWCGKPCQTGHSGQHAAHGSPMRTTSRQFWVDSSGSPKGPFHSLGR
jgi:hypothetical protein